MRSGRPAYHVKARFVSFYDIHNRSMIYFELDSKGNLKKNENGQFSSQTKNAFMVNNNVIAKPCEAPIVAKPSIVQTEIKSPIKEKEKIKEDSPPNEIIENRTEFNDEGFSFDDDFDIYNYPLNGTDFFFQDDNLFNFSENEPLNII